MRIVKPNHEILLPENPLRHIEKIGRICYKSEDAITEISAEPFVGRLFKSSHHAMLEHFRFIVEIHKTDYFYLMSSEYNKYITFTCENGRHIISASARGLNDMFVSIRSRSSGLADDVLATNILADIAELIVNHYNCRVIFSGEILSTFPPSEDDGIMRIIDNFDELSNYEYEMHAWYSILFTCDRGVTHEMVRHRDASFAQESTRYCNYSKGKYGSEITVIDPFFFDENEERKYINGCDWAVNKHDVWKVCMQNLEKAYMMLTELGAVPQQARTILPSSTKADIVITAQVYEWRHIFDLRVLGKTGTPHPQIKEVMEPAYNEMLANRYLR